MTTSIKANYQELVKKRQEISAFGEIDALLQWDQTVNMPPKGNAKRAVQMEALSGVVHDMKTSTQLGSLLEKLKDAQQATELNERERAVVRDSIREYKQQTAIPRELATRIAKLNAESYDAWVTAKKSKDFSIFKPFLQQLVDVSIEKAKLIDPTKPPYEVLMDDYERGLTCAKVDAVFGEVKKALVPLIEKIKTKPAPKTDFLKHEFDVDIQAKVSQQITKELGFDLERGRLDVSVHPFTTTIGAASDVRITSLYKRDDVITGLGATIHETGHALYEQGLDPEYAGLPSGNALSMGIHESQSLLWERMVGLSQSFWNHYYPLLLSSFSCLPRDSTAADFYGAMNLVTPSKIRVEADEVTYPLHIIIRYEIESGLISGKIKVDDDLPKLWNQKMHEYLGVKIENDSEGILQDIHWSMGAFGYFPTYTLGAIYASQFFKAAQEKIPTLDEQIGKGEFKDLKAWLNSNIHVHGALYPTGDELCKRVTGQELSAATFISHLTDKYTKLYKL